MTLPVTSDEGRGLSFRLFGFPVRIDPFFLIVLAILGWSGGGRLDRLAVWVAVAAVGVIVHELGHAFVARTTGAHPSITLHGLGGLTSFVPARPMSRLRSMAVTIAGPAVGITIGLLLLAIPADAVTAGSLSAYAIDVAVFVNLGWGVLNLLPVLPLDGGQVLRELLPGQPATRQRTAAIVSIAVAGAGAVVALRFGMTYAAVLAGWLAFSNVMALRPAPAPGSRPAPQPTAADRSALWLVDQGRLDDARHVVRSAPPGQVHLAVEGLVTALTGQPRVGGQLIVRAAQDHPGDPVAIGAYARLLAAAQDWESLQQLLASPAAEHVPPHVAALIPPQA